MSNVHPHLINRYREAISHAIFPVQSGSGTVSLKQGEPSEEELSLMVGPDGEAWLWLKSKSTDWLDAFISDAMIKVAISGTLSEGSRFEAVECYIKNIDMQGDRGTARHDASGWQLNLSGPPVFTILLTAPNGLQITNGQEIGSEPELEYVLLNAVFDGTEKTEYEEGQSFCFDAFSVDTGSRQWTMRTRRDFGKAEKSALDDGAIQFLPTAVACTRLKAGESLAELDEEAHVLCLLMSLGCGAASRWTARRKHGNGGSEWFFAGHRPTAGIKNRSHYEFISNHHPTRGLEALLNQCAGAYAMERSKFGLDRAVGFLEESRTQTLTDVQLLLAILAVESLTYYWCLGDDISPEQAGRMNIEQKLNRMAAQYPGIKQEVRKADLLRSDVRNPLMHTGQIPAMTVEEMWNWAERLYVLAFRMILTLIGYSGSFVDPTKDRSETVATLA